MMRCWLAIALAIVSVDRVVGQDDVQREIVIQPVQVVGQPLARNFRQIMPVPGQAMLGRQPNLQDAIQAKVTEVDGKFQVVFLAEAYREEVQQGQVTKFKQEVRTREILNAANGEKIRQDYTVTIPYTEDGEVTVRVPAGKKAIVAASDDCKFFNVANEELSIEEAAKLLSALRTVLLLDNTEGNPVELDPLMRDLLRPDSLIVVTKTVVREMPNYFPANAGFAPPAVQLQLAIPAPAAVPGLPPVPNEPPEAE